MTIYEILRENATKHPGRKAYYYFKKTGTYGELLNRVDRLAGRLAAAGVKCGQSVSICLPNSPAVLESLFAVNKLGARAVMLNPKSPAQELKRQMEMTDIKCIIYSTVCGKTVREVLKSSKALSSVPCFYSRITKELPLFFKFACLKKVDFNPIGECIDGARSGKHAANNGYAACSKGDTLNNSRYATDGKSDMTDNSRREEDSIGYATDDNEEAAVIFSGGTGGEYKAIVHSSRSMYNSAKSCEQLIIPYPDDIRMLSVLPSFHIFGLEVAIFLPICFGGACVLVPFFHIKTIAKIVALDCPDFIAGVPTIFKRIYQCGILQKYERKGKLKVDRFSWGFCGGDYLSENIRNDFNELIRRNGGKGYISMGYGMSECCPVAVAQRNVNEERYVGNVLTGCEITIHDEEGRPVPDGVKGEIYISSDFLMKKYFYEDKREYYPLVDEMGKQYIKTGDMGYMKGERLYYEYRMRRIIKVSGNTIFAGYVENVICSHPKVKNAIVVAVNHETRGNSTFAFVVCEEPFDREGLRREILELCREKLIPYAIPVGIEFCHTEDIKMTILGKIVYGELEIKARDIMSRG